MKANHVGLESHQLLGDQKEAKMEILSEFQMLAEVPRASSIKVDPPFEIIPNTYSGSVFHKGQVIKLLDSETQHRVMDLKDAFGRSVPCAFFTFSSCKYNKATTKEPEKDKTTTTENEKPKNHKARIMKRLWRMQRDIDQIMEWMNEDDEDEVEEDEDEEENTDDDQEDDEEEEERDDE